jgi:hypothetical protein
MARKQFHTKPDAKKFYDMSIKRWGADRSSRYLAVTRFIPGDWKYVRVIPEHRSDDEVILRIQCLYKETERARSRGVE